MTDSAIVECREAHSVRQPLHELKRFQHILAPSRQIEQQVAHALVVGVVAVAAKLAAGHGMRVADDAIRQIVLSLGPYPAFPADVAREYDVVEIRRTWTFDLAVRLFAGGR